MDIRPIRSEEDYDAALQEIAQFFDHEPLPGTSEADRFDVLFPDVIGPDLHFLFPGEMRSKKATNSSATDDADSQQDYCSRLKLISKQ